MGARERSMRARRRSIRTGAATIVGAVAMAAFAISAQNGLPGYLPGVDRDTVSAQFTDTGALRAGDDVRVAGVRAGFVESIDLVDGRPVVTMALDKAPELHQDATASIRSRSALGQKYIELNPGSPRTEPLASGDMLNVGQTRSSVELDDVLGVLDPRTRGATGSTLREVGAGVGGRGRDLNDGLAALDPSLRDVGAISEALAYDDGADLRDLLSATESLSTSLTSRSERIARTARQAALTMDAVAADDGRALQETVREAPAALHDVRGALESIDGPLRSTARAARRLRPGATALAEAMPDLRTFMRDSVPVLEKVPGVAAPAETAVLELTPTLGRSRVTVEGLRTALPQLSLVLGTLAPYSPEVIGFFEFAASALSQGDGAGRWLRFYPVVNPENVVGNLPIDSPLTNRDAYPAPGEAEQHRTNPRGGLR